VKYLYLDFEFKGLHDRELDLVCCTYSVDGETKDVWLYGDPQERANLAVRLSYYRKTHVFVAYHAEAEARGLMALGLEPASFKWIDLWLEYKCLINNNNAFSYGRQLIDGKEVYTYPPRLDGVEYTNAVNSSRAQTSLASACYKLLNKKIDTDNKDEMRDLIINKETYNEDERISILRYCHSDTVVLRLLLTEIGQRFKGQGVHEFTQIAIRRARYSVLAAYRKSYGYPIDLDGVRSLSSSVSSILSDVALGINKEWPEKQIFKWSKASETFIKKEQPLRDWIESTDLSSKWPKTATGKYSLSEENFSRYFPFKHHYPSDNLGAQMVRYLKTKKNLNGFLPKRKGTTFWDYVGEDGRVRPDMGIYGTQTGRSAPKATGFIPAKARWMRSLIVPPKGSAIITSDYSGQEFLLAALLSEDMQMEEAYQSGDPYMWLVKEITREKDPSMRTVFKTAMLGIMYGMGPHSLANSIGQKVGRDFLEEDAREIISQIFDTFYSFAEWRRNIVDMYREQGYLKTPDDWYMWGDNPNDRSVMNFPIQSMGATIMREADFQCFSKGLKVIYTLHDALYLECKVDQVELMIPRLEHTMQKAFQRFFPGHKIRLDTSYWTDRYVDEDSKEEYEFFSKYLSNSAEVDFL
jgi:hypothetical protein